jgi:hypothetical protein
MAYTYAEALNIVGRALPKVLEDQYSAVICNLATSEIWASIDWNLTMEALPPFYLIGGEQDHGPPQPVVPTDFMALRRAQIQRLSGEVLADLHVAANLNEVRLCGMPDMISYEAVKRAFRLYPRVPHGYGAPNYFVTGTYKKTPVQITNSTLQTALPLGDDSDFAMWLEAIRYAYYKLSGDQSRAGSVQMQGGRLAVTGQLAVMQMEIKAAAQEELRNRGEHAFHPNKPLASPRRY